MFNVILTFQILRILSADLQCLSILTASVSKDFENIQALNGDNTGPIVLQNCIISSIKSALPKTAPPTTRPCPSINFAAE